VKGTQSAELAKGECSQEKVGDTDLDHGQLRHWIEMAVQEEVNITLDELMDEVECNVLGLPAEPVPVDIGQWSMKRFS